MKFEITYDDKGNPYRVNTDDGFALVSRKFDQETDGWMLNQLRYEDFTSVRIGQEAEFLINQVNALRKEVFDLERELEQWKTAAGFGRKVG